MANFVTLTTWFVLDEEPVTSARLRFDVKQESESAQKPPEPEKEVSGAGGLRTGICDPRRSAGSVAVGVDAVVDIDHGSPQRGVVGEQRAVDGHAVSGLKEREGRVLAVVRQTK